MARYSGDPGRRSIFTSHLVNSSPDAAHPRMLEDMRSAMLTGDEPPGTIIPIDAVAAFFGVSAIPVREALRVLVGEGLVEHTPNVGYRVARIGFDEFCELYDVRQALEVAALRIAVRQATLEDDERVAAVHRSLFAALQAGDERAFNAESRRFHMALIETSRKMRMLKMYESAWNITEPVRPMSLVHAADLTSFYDDHDRMLAAFIARDAEALVAHSHAHYLNLRSAIEKLEPQWDELNG